ncbi:MAG: flagellar biosynthetic protein FliO [Bryobacteraceae bacterium]
MLAVAAVFGLLLATMAWLRRRGLARPPGTGSWHRPPRRLELVDRLSLTPQHSLHLVRMGERAILVGRSPSGLSLLESVEWRPQEDVAP